MGLNLVCPGRQTQECIQSHPKYQGKQKDFQSGERSKNQGGITLFEREGLFENWCNVNKELKGGRVSLISSKRMVFSV